MLGKGWMLPGGCRAWEERECSSMCSGGIIEAPAAFEMSGRGFLMPGWQGEILRPDEQWLHCANQALGFQRWQADLCEGFYPSTQEERSMASVILKLSNFEEPVPNRAHPNQQIGEIFVTKASSSCRALPL